MSLDSRRGFLISGMDAVVFSPDGTKIATASPDNDILICDVKTGTCLHTFTGHKDIIHSMDWHEDKIISGSQNGEVVLWDLSEFDLNTVDEDWDLEVSTIKSTFLGFLGSPIKKVAISENGSKLMSLSRDSLTVWQADNHRVIKVIIGQPGAEIRDTCFSPDSKYIAIAAADALKIVTIGDVVFSQGAVFQIPGDHRNIDWKKNHIATTTPSDGGRIVQVFKIAGDISNKMVTRIVEFFHMQQILELELSPDSMRIAFSGSLILYEFDISTNTIVLSAPLKGIINDIEYSPDGTFICTLEQTPYIHFWDDVVKRKQIIESHVKAYVKEYEDGKTEMSRDMMNASDIQFLEVEKMRYSINDLRQKLNGYFLQSEIDEYAKEFSLTRGLSEEYAEYSSTQGLGEQLMRREYKEPISLEYPESAAGGGSSGKKRSARGEGPRKRLKIRRRKLTDSIILRF